MNKSALLKYAKDVLYEFDNKQPNRPVDSGIDGTHSDSSVVADDAWHINSLKDVWGPNRIHADHSNWFE